jgi:hypothetical protein
VPVVSVRVAEPGVSPGHIFITPGAKAGARTGPAILDSAGRLVWFHRLSATRTAVGLKPQTLDGKPVLTWSQRPPITGDGLYDHTNPRLYYNVIADQHYRVIRRMRAKGHGVRTDLHDFVLTSRGTALVLGFRFLPRNLERYGGSRHGRIVDALVQEIDIKTGRVLFSWSAARHVPLSDSYLKDASGNWDWFHINSVAEALDGNLLISARHASAVYKVDRRTGDVMWVLGGKRSSFKMGPGTRFYYQHDARRRPDGTLTVFDNASTEFDKTHGTTTKVLRLALDTDNMTATLAREYDHPKGDGTLATSQGNAQLLPGGDMFVGWGNSPWFSEFSPTGKLLFAAHLPSATYQSYRAFKGVWQGQPTGAPRIAASHSSTRTLVYASWNGATDIAAWRVFGGADAGSLKELTTRPWAELETKIEAPGRPAVVQVQALDAAGNVLGTSPPISPK